MTSATSSTRHLPKSKFHQNIASTPTESRIPKVPLHEAPPHENIHLEADAPSFLHPGHVIPPRNYPGIDTLIIVCCHAIFHPDPNQPSFPLCSPFDEKHWHLAPFQMSNPVTGKPGEHETFLAHITAGLDAPTTGSCAAKSLLVFSGGATKPSLTSLTEARSYYNAALALALSRGSNGGGHAKSLFDKGWILLEEYATDSFQNLLFSILRFRQATGAYPKQIRVITHAFKARRFLDLHAPAIAWPADRIRVQGIDPVMSRKEYEETCAGERRFGFEPWKQDPLGLGELLGGKRIQRGWRHSAVQELGANLEESVRQLLEGRMVDDLPWRVVEPQKNSMAED
ncbi:uncharacterized protein EI97DRAFT_324785 [Westerdykella ornata]|uniref:DUF218 domain-containing protein n=1 Tax=Westerdykella ornata TaxID=318751 RepID=A0A6A6JPL8_WESOR|nr:uncharacterized protein EI97DRAFT_324785 [Westerdykella ornata]KAF2276899.1 hypothetical protein EI97DRAFT_324785 [Westerdykella ornata]